jgi:large repetitive protein
MKSDAPDPVLELDTLTYTLPVTNNGPSPATLVTVTDTLPGTVTFISATASQGGCTPAGGPPGGTVTCTLGTLASGASATVTIQVGVPCGTGGTLTNTASVVANEPDPDGVNNTATATTTVLSSSGCL